jgi:hypothetical protein
MVVQVVVLMVQPQRLAVLELLDKVTLVEV